MPMAATSGPSASHEEKAAYCHRPTCKIISQIADHRPAPRGEPDRGWGKFYFSKFNENSVLWHVCQFRNLAGTLIEVALVSSEEIFINPGLLIISTRIIIRYR